MHLCHLFNLRICTFGLMISIVYTTQLAELTKKKEVFIFSKKNSIYTYFISKLLRRMLYMYV